MSAKLSGEWTREDLCIILEPGLASSMYDPCQTQNLSTYPGLQQRSWNLTHGNLRVEVSMREGKEFKAIWWNGITLLVRNWGSVGAPSVPRVLGPKHRNNMVSLERTRMVMKGLVHRRPFVTDWGRESFWLATSVARKTAMRLNFILISFKQMKVSLGLGSCCEWVKDWWKQGTSK